MSTSNFIPPPPDRRDLHEAGERQIGQRGRERSVEVEEQPQRGELEEGRAPGGGDLHGAEVVAALVRRRPDEVEGQAVVGQAEELLQELVLKEEEEGCVTLSVKNRIIDFVRMVC